MQAFNTDPLTWEQNANKASAVTHIGTLQETNTAGSGSWFVFLLVLSSCSGHSGSGPSPLNPIQNVSFPFNLLPLHFTSLPFLSSGFPSCSLRQVVQTFTLSFSSTPIFFNLFGHLNFSFWTFNFAIFVMNSNKDVYIYIYIVYLLSKSNLPPWSFPASTPHKSSYSHTLFFTVLFWPSSQLLRASPPDLFLPFHCASSSLYLLPSLETRSRLSAP